MIAHNCACGCGCGKPPTSAEIFRSNMPALTHTVSAAAQPLCAAACCRRSLGTHALLPAANTHNHNNRYIKWTQEQYSTQASRKELSQVLEAAAKSLSSSRRYNDDVRLLRIWVQYVSAA